jgi:hypothetical protein
VSLADVADGLLPLLPPWRAQSPVTLQQPGGQPGGQPLGSLGALPEDLSSLAWLNQGPERQEVATRCRSAAERMLALPEKLDPETVSGAES